MYEFDSRVRYSETDAPVSYTHLEKRGLPNIKSMVDAIPAYTAPESVAAFEKFGVFTKPELESYWNRCLFGGSIG